MTRTHRGRHLPLLMVAVALTSACGGGPGPNSADSTDLSFGSDGASGPPPLFRSRGPLLPRPSGAATAPTQDLIDFLISLVERDPGNAEAQRDLGLALLQRFRETADPSLYQPAEAALKVAQELRPDDPLVLVGLGGLQLGRHEFADALVTGEAALRMAPGDPRARAVVIDALVELGRYDDGLAAAEALARENPDLASMARLSYARELRGDLPRALASMERAAGARGLAPENTAFVLALVGQLRRLSGDIDGAAAAYEKALTFLPDYAPSLAGLGRLAVGRGDLDTARDRFEQAAAVVPLPEYVVALGQTLQEAGDTEGAADQFELARALITLFQANGVVVDVELSLFEADHGDPTIALRMAEEGYAATPTVRAADTRAWALYRLGRFEEAERYSAEAMRLGSRDPLFLFHAGAIAAARGRDDDARRLLREALATDPGFSPTGAAEARSLLADLGG